MGATLSVVEPNPQNLILMPGLPGMAVEGDSEFQKKLSRFPDERTCNEKMGTNQDIDSDWALLLRFSSTGDEAAFRSVVERHAPLVGESYSSVPSFALFCP